MEHYYVLALQKAHPRELVPGFRVKVRVDGLDGKAEVRKEAKSPVEVMVDHV